jgi:hypothetical protein
MFEIAIRELLNGAPGDLAGQQMAGGGDVLGAHFSRHESSPFEWDVAASRSGDPSHASVFEHLGT